jgi:hypothetical protein
MHKGRLLTLVDLLEADANNPNGIQFDLDQWGANSGGEPVEVSCGTKACAMGLAVISGVFKEQGLFNGSTYQHQIFPVMTSGRSGFGAAAELFDISYREAELLFCPEFYDDEPLTGADGELAVARRIREFVGAA